MPPLAAATLGAAGYTAALSLDVMEHNGLAPDADVVKWQRRIEPIWKRIAGGCHLTRPVTSAIAGQAWFYALVLARVVGMAWTAPALSTLISAASAT